MYICTGMVIISKKMINEFIALQPGAEGPLLRWYLLVKESDWSSFNALKKDIGSADLVGDDLCVFNIGGNKFRLVSRIFFKVRTVYIRFIGTHAQYDKIMLSEL